MNRLFLSLLLLMAAFSGHAQTADDKPGEPAPAMRPMDRDWSYFKDISCNQIHRIQFHSRSEEMLVAKRKSQCLHKYDAFMPKPIERR